MNPTEILAHAKSRRNARAALAAALVVCAIGLVGGIAYMATRSPEVSQPPTQLAQAPQQGRVLLTVAPAGAVRVKFDGVDKSAALPLALEGVVPGKHTLLVERDGYITHRESMDIAPGEFKPVHVDLVKAK